jgi:hypothetical protein
MEYQRRKADAAAKADRAREERKQWETERREERRRQEQRMLAVAQGCQIFVGGLALRCEEDSLLAYFSRFGRVSDHTIVRDSETRLSRGFGFVTFPDAQDAAAAVGASHGVEVRDVSAPHGRLSVRLAEKSKAQLEFEARRSAARAGMADGDKSEKAQAEDGDYNNEIMAGGVECSAGGVDREANGCVAREWSEDEAAVGEAAAAATDSSVSAHPVVRATAVARPMRGATADARSHADTSRAEAAQAPPPPPPVPPNAVVRQWPAPPTAVSVPPASAGPKAAPSERRAKAEGAAERRATAAAGAKLGRGDDTEGAFGRRSSEKPPRPAGEALPAGAEAA